MCFLFCVYQISVDNSVPCTYTNHTIRSHNHVDFLFSLGSTCNHIPAILFKVDFAWQQGMTQKSCTSLPCKWNVPSLLNNIQHKPISELEWRKPHYSKKGMSN